MNKAIKISNKELLSNHVEEIFKKYISPGVYICDIATGGGKTYTIGKLTCQYYSLKFDRIIILCVQNKLVQSMNQEIDRFISSKESLIKQTDKLVIENNLEVITKAINNGSFEELLNQMQNRIGEQKNTQIQYSYNLVKKNFEKLSGLLKMSVLNEKKDYLQEQINESESKLRVAVRDFFDTYKKHLEETKQIKKNEVEKFILRNFSALKNVYPQVEYSTKKVLIMTVHKAMYGIDPILSEKIHLPNFANKKKTLIFFDESDQAAVSMRNVIIDQAINNAQRNKLFAYSGYLQYKELIDHPECICSEYYGSSLEKSFHKAQTIIQKNWKRTFKEIIPYKNIFLNDIVNIENYRRGVFFSGPILKLNIKADKETNSYICYSEGDKHFQLVHSNDTPLQNSGYDIVVPMDQFLSMAISNTTVIKSQFFRLITESLQKSHKEFEEQSKALASNTSTQNKYLTYPTLEREIHTFFSRFESPSELQFEQQMNEFITNRKNIRISNDKKNINLPDYSVYSQGVQLFLEEIDERDNQRRVRLSCREITTTPEKIIIDLVNTPNTETTIILCSATASSNSVVSNFDIKYLKQILYNKVYSLSFDQRQEFDKLIEKTYPAGHKIEIVPLKKIEFTNIDLTVYYKQKQIPDEKRYEMMFSEKARKDGLLKKWFKITCRQFLKRDSSNANLAFYLYRLFQFIEAYHWFYTHNDIHSMLYFQNRTGDKDRDQINVLSCLIDGSYEKYPELEDIIPSDWENDHIRISKDWEEVESSILKELSENKNTKLMLVSAYASFKAGANMQYEIPDSLDYIAGDSWNSSSKKLKKDWDSIYLQTPTSYLMMNEDGNEQTFEKSLYNIMLTLMMLKERGCLSTIEVANWIYKALTNSFYFGEKNNPGIAKDKAAWTQTIVEQAVGRLCRTRNKPHTTYILFDESMTSLFHKSNIDKSLTKEFKELAQYILSHPVNVQTSDVPEEVIRYNNANDVQNQLDLIRKIALHYTSSKEDFEEDENDDIPYNVGINQFMNQQYKKIIIKKPVINSLDELTEEDRKLPFISKCYGDWKRNENNEYIYRFDSKKVFLPIKNSETKLMSPSSVRLDILMKNDVIRKYFENQGYATEWKKGGLILHPQILQADYAGEIGEEAFKALVLHYTNCKEEDFVHLEGKDYELADFVIKNTNGNYRIAFDVKNWSLIHNDRPNDVSTSEKRKSKEERLGCKIITVNMVKIKGESINETEILGMITKEGQIIDESIQRIKQLINS